jgi:beta-glucosidase
MELEGFKRVHMEAGAEQDVALTLKAHALAYWDATSHSWHVEKERVRVLAGGSSDKLPVQAELEVTGDGQFKP